MTSIASADARPPPLSATAAAAAAATPPPLPFHHELPRLSSHPANSPAAPPKQGGEAGVSSSHDGHSTDDRPAKRRKLSTDGEPGVPAARVSLVDDYRFLSALVRERAAVDDGPASADFPPLPQRPWRLAAASKKSGEDAAPTHRARSPVPVPTTPDTGYSADGVPKFSNHRPIAYFAWTGKHAEDRLSTESVKSGYFDRPPNPPEKETNTARVPVYNALKYHGGIDTLSTLFSLVLEAKSKHCLITSASTFKPPPRVTLAEAKRKSWISDLADVNVPLRKLSRTIPQGIRGQGLLDQCIQNRVPLSRAIWFAKCVGANEIRTLKRKGTTPQAAVGTEAKWVREWTVNVQQFVENVVAQAGRQPTWRADFQYALRLATRLYLDNLLDRDHYLDWLSKAFSLSTDEQLPSWLLLLHIYKRDLVGFRRRGRPLAEAVLTRYAKMKDVVHPMAQSLAKKLRDLVRQIALLRPGCFLMPDQWPVARDGLQSCLDVNKAADSATLRYLDTANTRCMGSNRHLYRAKVSEQDGIVTMLDRAKAPYNLPALSQALLRACPEARTLVTYCLEWATTKFRCGSARVYLISRLVRRWLRDGLDVDAAIVDFFDQAVTSPGSKSAGALEHIFSHLSRSSAFSASQWLQAMNVRGLPPANTVRTRTIVTPSATSLQQQWADVGTALLMHLSLPRSSRHVVNLRNALLERAGYSLDAETDAVRKIMAQLEQELRNLPSSDRAEAARRTSIRALLTGWNWRVRNEISHWLRAFAAEAVRAAQAQTQMPKPDEHQQQQQQQQPQQPSTLPSLEQKQFLLIRTALETVGDKPVLADVVNLYAFFTCEQVQASLAETVSRHAESFSAIGALEALQAKLTQTYMSLRTVKATMPLFATALLDLSSLTATETTGRATSAKLLLQQDLVRGDRGRAMAACSPFSDGVAESLQQADATFVDDFEAVLQSEPTMSEQAMSRLFELLTERIEKQQGTIVGEDALFSYCQLMARLRWCGRLAQSDRLLKTWLVKALSKYASTFTRNLVLTLIATGCLTIDLLVEAVAVIGIPTVLAHHSWLLSPASIAEHPYAYVTATKCIAYSKRKPAEALKLLGYAAPADRERYERPVCINLVQGGAGASSIDVASLPPPSRASLEKNLASLLGDDGDDKSGLPLRSALSVLDDGLSTRFVQAQLRLLSGTSTAEECNAIASAIYAIVNDPLQPVSTTDRISVVLQAAEGEVAAHVRQMAEDRVLNLLPRIVPAPNGLVLDSKLRASLGRAVEQAFQLCPSASGPSPKSSQRLVDVLSQMLKYLKSYSSDTPAATSVPKTPTTTATSPSTTAFCQQQQQQQQTGTGQTMGSSDGFAASVLEYLRIVLQLLCLQRPSVCTTAGETAKQSSDAIRIVAHLAAIITHHELTSAVDDDDDDDGDGSLAALAHEVTDFAYDVMATYVDEASDESRQLLSKLLRDKLRDGSDPRLRCLFGSVGACGSEMPGGEELGKGLVVAKRDADGALRGGGGGGGGGGGKIVGDWRPKVWEVLETGGRSDTDVSIGLGLFGARRV